MAFARFSPPPAALASASAAAVAVAVAVALTAGAESAHAKSATARCGLSPSERLPANDKPTYVLSLTRAGTSCGTAKRVARAFHACRSTTGTRCARRLAGSWRCSARRSVSAARLFDAELICRSGRRRVRSSYHQRAAGTPACYGAAARDRARPCVVPERPVYPPLSDLDAGTSYPCRPAGGEADACTFGAPARRARGHVAIVGDSHALAMRTAVDIMARAKRWRGYSLTAPGCPFSEAVHNLYPGASEPCVEWYESVQAWFRRHPEVTTVFVTSFAPMPIVVPPGTTYGAVKVAGFQRAWRALPRTVRRIVAIRDPPMTSDAQYDCVRAAVRARAARPEIACPQPRAKVLKWDTSQTAARLLRSRRYRSVDLTRYFCSGANCYPIIGRVIVYRDAFGHITNAFGGTLAPMLLQRVDRLLAAR